jgi:hypothetical protein
MTPPSPPGSRRSHRVTGRGRPSCGGRSRSTCWRAPAVASLVVPICWLVLLPGIAGALDDGVVLPRGRFRVLSDAHFFLPFDKRYDPDGKPEDLAADFNRSLDSSVFRLLAPLDRFVGGRASIGDARVEIDIDPIEVEFTFQYGEEGDPVGPPRDAGRRRRRRGVPRLRRGRVHHRPDTVRLRRTHDDVARPDTRVGPR